MPFQFVNDSSNDAIVGTHTSPTCRTVGTPTISRKTVLSRPWNCDRRRRFLGADSTASAAVIVFAIETPSVVGATRELSRPVRRRRDDATGRELMMPHRCRRPGGRATATGDEGKLSPRG